MKNVDSTVLVQHRKSVLHPQFDSASITGSTKGEIQSFDYVDAAPGMVEHARPMVVPRGAPVAVAGWAVASRDGEVPRAVSVVLDRHRAHAADGGLARTDIAEEHGTPLHVGYRCVVPTEELPPGAHELRVYALGADDGWREAGYMPFRIFEDARIEFAPHRREVRLGIDFAGYLHGGEAGNRQPVPRGRPGLIAGWAFDSTTKKAPAGVVAVADSGEAWSGPCGTARPDVATAFGAADPGLGFEIVVPTDVLAHGRHVLRLAAYDEDGRRFGSSAEVTLEIVGPALRYPLTARLRDEPIVFGAALAAAGEDARFRTRFFPSGEPVVEVAHGGAFLLEGWAVARNGGGAAEVFAEIAPHGTDVPPHRHIALAGWRRDDPLPKGFAEPPVEDGWFRCPLGTTELSAGDWDLALTVVDPGRRSLRRVRLATLRVSEAAAEA